MLAHGNCTKCPLPAHVHQLVEHNQLLVKKISNHLASKMPSCIQVEDLFQSGMVGLIEAAKKYDASRGASFETFAGIRIRGAILDEIRRGDWGPRSVYRNSRKITETVQQLEAKLGRNAKDSEVAEYMGISLSNYYNILNDLRGCRLFSFEEVFESEDSRVQAQSKETSPQLNIQKQKFKNALKEAIEGLPERERLVLTLYYEEEMNLKEIGSILGVSESRVSQIHSQAALRLRSRLEKWAA